jgi:hypothetical protein
MFACTSDETCWCAAESFRLPLPAPGAAGIGQDRPDSDRPDSDCLCRDCLRRLATAAQSGGEPSAN